MAGESRFSPPELPLDMFRQALRWVVLSFAVLASGCGGLREWLAPFRGLNSDVNYSEPGVGQYRQPADHEPQPGAR